MNTKYRGEVPIFFAVDDNYIPFFGVALKSLIDNSSKEYMYQIKVLYTSITNSNMEKMKKYESNNLKIEFIDLNERINAISHKLYTRDYFSKTTYYRLLIPDLYPEYDKVLYLDSDIVVLDDITKLYNTDIGNNLLAAAPDDVIQTINVFREYSEKVVGVSSYRNYFNAGILLMNLQALREFKFKDKFLYLLGTIKFSVAQDQDYLNRLCKGRVTLLPKTWNKMPVSGDSKIDRSSLHIVHYNLAFKPWHFDNVLYQDFFWKYAKKTEFYNEILEIKSNFSDEDKKKYSDGDKKLRALAQMECDCVGDDRVKYNEVYNQSMQQAYREDAANSLFEGLFAYDA